MRVQPWCEGESLGDNGDALLEELVKGVTDDAVVGGAVLLENGVGVVAVELSQGTVQRADVETTAVLGQEVGNTVKHVLLARTQAGHEEAVGNLNVSGSHEAVGGVELGEELVGQGGGGKDDVQEVHDLLRTHRLEVVRGGSLSSVLQPLVGKRLASLSERVLQQGAGIEGGKSGLVQPGLKGEKKKKRVVCASPERLWVGSPE